MINYTGFSAEGGLFACANSGFGFVSHFEELFKDYPTLYLVKGGSGTGKSSFMKRVWREAIKRDLPTLPILCSSDPSSFDGLLLPTLGIALADATPPHLIDPLLPGAREELIDTGRFWNADILKKHKTELETLSKQKKELYRKVYLLLEGGKNVALCSQDIAKELLIEERVDRVLSGWQKKAGAQTGKIRSLFDRALSMQGALLSDALLSKAQRIYTLQPTSFGGELLLIKKLFLKVQEKKQSCILLSDPLTLCPAALYFEESGVLFRCGEAVGSEKEKIIDPRRLIDRPSKKQKERSKQYREAEGILTKEALSLLSDIKILHLQMEQIYGRAMDFSALEEAECAFIERLFKDRPPV